MKPHQESEMQQVWNSFEWLYREKLEAIDHLTRQMIREMNYSGVSMAQIRRFVPVAFKQLWDQVASEQEGKTPERRRGTP